MNPTTLIGAASTLFKNDKMKIAFVALQLGYLTYKFVQNKKELQHQNIEN
ncbi:hypothetical protein BN863_18360 [Formosa agariphila KMM 3901]|uniref:Uncharacterized protein n=1 Tax=Formosa agariphila (strain DSM 15362 / KCTC 12365 / LMG 23005 / KMM 3901 / M-2Alg 35-1) TaxID=1347342 RepID=T2KM59_FORAG|nr:hypothetical protein [Formosa agariphila]CDF79548.1 hypothetical protein BN863_18360 [Formosa agariphila KMM 3901]